MITLTIPKITVGDTVVMKKKHPCGGDRFSVLYAGSDIKLRCVNCGKDVIIPRVKAEKMIKNTAAKTEKT